MGGAGAGGPGQFFEKGGFAEAEEGERARAHTHSPDPSERRRSLYVCRGGDAGREGGGRGRLAEEEEEEGRGGSACNI